MGAQQSSDGGSNRTPATATTPKTCYYELLGVERMATEEELKKAYRKKALELHPDRNFNNVEVATQQFAEVQAAYDILSDPQERAWYDSHRDAILSGDDGYGDGADGPATAFHNVRLTTTAEILNLMRRFDSTVPFNDEPTGFFGIARETFEHLAMEEQAAADFDGTDCPDYPTFGSSEDEYEPIVKLFYSSWVAFSSRKSFSWKDKYRLSDAPDRRVRRLMEKENKKFRDDALREFNDAVRFLVKFVRKRDPRYLPNTQSEAERQKAMRDAAAAQATRSRVANQEKLAAFQMPEWATSRDGNGSGDGSNVAVGAGTAANEGGFSESEEEEEVEVLECVVCNKIFKSDKQLEAHERSKKHVKAVRQLRHQMRKEGAELNLDSDEGDGSQKPLAPDDSGNVSEVDALQDSSSRPGTEPLHPPQGDPEPHRVDQPASSPFTRDEDQDRDSNRSPEATPASDDEYASREAVVSRLAKDYESAAGHTDFGRDNPERELSDAMGQTSLDNTIPEKKMGKAKAKRAKKAAAADATSATDMHKCSVCAVSFPSRTKLFRHVHDEGHAAAVPAPHAGAKSRKGKQRR